MNTTPLLFRPVYKDYLWGGSRISSLFSREGAPTPCAESWEISAHPDGASVVAGGPYDGRTLADLTASFGVDLVGSLAEDPEKFPLLFKLIDAKDRLSVQVHPDEASAARYGGEAKTEMWYFLDATPGSVVCAGFKSGVSPRIFADAVRQKSVSSLLRAVEVVPGKALYIPGGLVHAICEGCLVFEVQQSSNTTYRIHDWDRVGADGKPRELHVKKAEEILGWKMPEMDLREPIPMHAATAGNRRECIVRSDFFTMERFSLAAAEPFAFDGSTFAALFAAKGSLRVATGDGEVLVPFGRSCLVPACAGTWSVAPADGNEAEALFVTL